MRRFEPYYPGHDVVDVVALDGYNWGRRRWWHRWRGFDAIFSASYAALRRLAPDKTDDPGRSRLRGDRR